MTKQEAHEAHLDQRLKAARQETAHAKFVGSVTNEEKQKGKWMTSTRFMNRLRKLNKDLVMVPHPQKGNPLVPQVAHTGLLYLEVGGERIYLFPCEDDWMPEWSVMGTLEVREPVAGTTAWQRVIVPGEVARRGWREVLIRLVQKGLVTLAAAEQEFGAGDRQSWQVLTGKATAILPM